MSLQSSTGCARPTRQGAAVALAAALLLGGCATLANPPDGRAAAGSGFWSFLNALPVANTAPGAPVTTAQSAPGTNPGAAATPGAATAPPAPGQPPPFAVVIRDAKKTDGLIGVWQREERVWLELKPEDFDKPFFLSPKLSSGIGEERLYGGAMPPAQVVEFKRVHNQVRLVALNTRVAARGNGPEARAVAAGFSPSLLSSSFVSSQPHPERKTVLVDASPLLLGDLLGLGIRLQRTYRQGYGLDPRHTTITQIRGSDDHVVFNVQAHFVSGGIAAATPGMPPGAPVPTVPGALPDPRSMFIGIHYSLAKLPEQPMGARKADARLGYFTTTTLDFSDDTARTPRQRVINRWRLEKKDPAAALSEPVKPITFWLDRTIPIKYRDAVTKGVLGWNAAFEKIGFKDAIVAKVQPDDAAFDTLDVGVASIRWLATSETSFVGIGPSQVDPRSGEILDADIALDGAPFRRSRFERARIFGNDTALARLMQLPAAVAPSHADHASHADACEYADQAAEQLAYAIDAMALSSEQTEQFVLDYITDVVMHEVGHGLGLRHNFRSSKVYTSQQLADRAFTAANGVAGSVMDYNPPNLPRPRETGGTAWQTVLGPYDYWAIEYGYRPIAPADEKTELARIAARSSEPQLAFASDEESFLGLDPDALQWDLGDDPIAFARKELAIANDLVRRQETRQLSPNEDYALLSRSLGYALGGMARAAGVLARQIGGLRTLRDYPGSGRDPLQPVDGRVQRDALDILASSFLAADSLVLSPALQRRLAPDFLDRSDAFLEGALRGSNHAFMPVVASIQRTLLGQLMSDSVATRVIDNAARAEAASRPLQLSELYATLSRVVWSDLMGRDDIVALRRELQREHVNRLANQLLRPSAASRADTRSLLRHEARTLLTQLERAAGRRGWSAETRAHLSDSADTLRQALDAKMQRLGV